MISASGPEAQDPSAAAFTERDPAAESETPAESHTPPLLPASAESHLPAATPSTESLDDQQPLEDYGLHPQAIRLWSWGHAIAIVVVILPLAIAGSVLAGAWAIAAAAALAGPAWWLAAWHLRRSVAYFRCQRFAQGLRYRHGVWWQSEVFVPAGRIQHTEVNQGPLARRYGIGTLKVYTAAVQLGTLDIGGLAHADAMQLRDRLLGRTQTVAIQPQSETDAVALTND